MTDSKLTTDRRTPERRALEGDVVVEFDATTLIGPGQNISEQGVFFIADGRVPVKVRIDGEDVEKVGEIVRVESMGGGRLGIAVKFD